MIFTHSRKILALVITLAFAAVTALPAYAQASTFTDREIVPFDSVEIACNGEVVFLSGDLLLMSHATLDARGGLHFNSTLVPLHIRGVGSDTGTVYKAVGGDRSHFNFDADFAPYSFTETSMFNLVSQGGSQNIKYKLTLHVTVNAKGVETVTVEHFSSRCVG